MSPAIFVPIHFCLLFSAASLVNLNIKIIKKKNQSHASTSHILPTAPIIHKYDLLGIQSQLKGPILISWKNLHNILPLFLMAPLLLTAFDPRTIIFEDFCNCNNLLITTCFHVDFYLRVPCFQSSLENPWVLIFPLQRQANFSSKYLFIHLPVIFFNNKEFLKVCTIRKSDLLSYSLREYSLARFKTGIIFAIF